MIWWCCFLIFFLNLFFTIIPIKGVVYHCIIHDSKYEAIHMSENSLLDSRGYI